MKKIIQDIETRKFERVYLIFGEERYLVRNLKKQLTDGISSSGDKMNISNFSGKDCDSKKIIDLAETLPFFSEYREIIIEDSGWFKSAEETMLTYIKDIPDTTVLIFVESEVDKRSKMYKQVKSTGYICECQHPSEAELMNWILKKFQKEHKKITKDTMKYLLAKVGNDMENVNCELEKLISYTFGKEVIEQVDIDAVCIGEITGKIFEMIDAIGNKNQKKALDLYYDLIAVREAPMKILYMLSRQFNIMYQVKELSEKHFPSAQIATNMGMQNFIINKTLSQCKNFKLQTISNALKYAIRLEEAVKTGNMNDTMAVELIIVKYSAV